MPSRPVAVFDSGVGGLSVLREVHRLLPGEDLLYLADQAHVPYGPRAPEEVRGLCEGAARFLLAQGAKLVVVACNTACAAALHHLRETFPCVPFVGMEPAVKPAARASRSGVIGVLATPGTLQGRPFCSVVERFAQGVRVLTRTCPGLVEAVEAGETGGPRLRALVEEAVAPLLAEGIDALVMGCTHYPLALAAIREVCGPGVELVDPAPAVARQVRRRLEELGLRRDAEAGGRTSFATTGDRERLAAQLRALWSPLEEVRGVRWRGGEVG
ncbi:MAG: glutamate racemase [Thermodesulfobacteriota bacterium]